jgi:acetate kinase
MNILVLNGGSSSVKTSLYRLPDGGGSEDAVRPTWKARAEFPHVPGEAHLYVDGKERTAAIQSPGDSLAPLLETLDRSQINAVGHRIVHGGKAFRESTRITPEVKQAIASLASFAPEHNLLEVEGIEAMERLLDPSVPQVAVFDTAFHATLAPAAFIYPGPYDWVGDGIRRYGFHGVSHQYVSRRAAQMLGATPARMVTCHLGNGCSLAAIRDGRSIDTTMGFTPLAGLMMGTRCGSIDPGIVIHLVRHCGSTPADLDRILNKQSGLAGISGISGDMREILTAIAQGNERARLAYEIYLHRLCAEIGSLLPDLGGLDALVFTAGVGENCAPLRQGTADAFAFLGVKLDAARNESGNGDREISAGDSTVRVLVVHTEEEWEIARECRRIAAS